MKVAIRSEDLIFNWRLHYISIHRFFSEKSIDKRNECAGKNLAKRALFDPLFYEKYVSS